MTVDLVAVARLEFLPRVKANVHANLSFKGNFFFSLLVRANAQNHKTCQYKERMRARSGVWVAGGWRGSGSTGGTVSASQGGAVGGTIFNNLILESK